LPCLDPAHPCRWPKPLPNESHHKTTKSNSTTRPAPQVLLSASGDKTLKLWSLKDGACLRTFEGHGAGVLRCRFATAGLQALSTGGRMRSCARSFAAVASAARARMPALAVD
jgi:WD40 repeat protein